MTEVPGFDLNGFGRRVLARRKELGLTQIALAAAAGVDESAVRRWEEGVLPRDAGTLARLAVALERSVGWVLGERESPAFIDGIRLALDHMRRVAEDDIGRLATNRPALLIEMQAGYAPPQTAESIAEVDYRDGLRDREAGQRREEELEAAAFAAAHPPQQPRRKAEKEEVDVVPRGGKPPTSKRKRA